MEIFKIKKMKIRVGEVIFLSDSRYNYVVNYYDPYGITRKRAYFNTKTAANKFRKDEIARQEYIYQLYDSQSATDIVAYRKLEEIGKPLGLSPLQMTELYAKYYNIFKEKQLPDLETSLIYFVDWLKGNNIYITLGEAVF